MSFRLGMDAKLYYQVDGVAGSGGWVELGNAKDVTLNLEAGEADVSTRANAGWRATAQTLKEASVEWEMVWNTGDAGFTAIKDAYLQNKVIGLKVLDGPDPKPVGGVAAQGLKADFMITKFSRNEPLEEAITVAVTAKIAYSATAPAWYTGA